MTEYTLYQTLLLILLITAPINFFWLLYSTAPYGRHLRAGWGPTLPNWLGWIIMECPTILVMLYFFMLGQQEPVAYVLLVLWMIHYGYRALIFPFRLRDAVQPMPMTIPLAGFLFTFAITYVNGYSITIHYSYALSWLCDPRFILGVTISIVGFIINHHSDEILLNLRKPGEVDYKIPYGGLYRWISCPNYLGEILEWVGWAIATWSLAGLAFALWTMATLVPRALDHHRWYQENFPNYPKERKAIFYKIL